MGKTKIMYKFKQKNSAISRLYARMNALVKAYKAGVVTVSVQSTVRIQALQCRADVLGGGDHLSASLASAFLLVVKRAVVLFWKAVKQTKHGPCRHQSLYRQCVYILTITKIQ